MYIFRIVNVPLQPIAIVDRGRGKSILKFLGIGIGILQIYSLIFRISSTRKLIGRIIMAGGESIVVAESETLIYEYILTTCKV